jgi:hypothetical protein
MIRRWWCRIHRHPGAWLIQTGLPLGSSWLNWCPVCDHVTNVQCTDGDLNTLTRILTDLRAAETAAPR